MARDSKNFKGADLEDNEESVNRRENCRLLMTTFQKGLKATYKSICRQPLVLAVPLFVTALIISLGVWGITSASNTYSSSKRDSARSTASDVAVGFELQVQETFTPAVTINIMVEQYPEWNYWNSNFEGIAEELMSKVKSGSIFNIELQPFGQIRLIVPQRYRSSTKVGKDLLLYPVTRPEVLSSIATHQQQVHVFYLTPENFTAAIVRQPIYINGTSPNETFGYSFPGANYSTPQFPQNVSYPPSVPPGYPDGYAYNCSVCYNASTATQNSSRWWGFITLVINLEEIYSGPDSRFNRLLQQGFKYALNLPDAAFLNNGIYLSNPLTAGGGVVDASNAISVNISVPGQTWYLLVSVFEDNDHLDGWHPSWRTPLIVADVVVAMILGTLLFISLLMYQRSRELLLTTQATNKELEHATEALEVEKTRLDALVERQYGLLACLDASNSASGFPRSSNATTIRAAGGLSAGLIEDARRYVLDAQSRQQSTEQMMEQLEIYEQLGEGAFGKVHRGLWRGSEVAVKTLILPSNMPGSEKREKMAVMEAAISSSLVHPNIVTTYTYAIKPHAEEMDFVHGDFNSSENLLADKLLRRQMEHQQVGHDRGHNADQRHAMMPARPGFEGPLDATAGRCLSGSLTVVHSYEVRLILEYCDGGSLHDLLRGGGFRQGGKLCYSAVLETAADVAQAMVHMHAAGVLHSDLKAQNIMLKSSGSKGRGFVAKVADFGMSSQMNQAAKHLSSMFQGTVTHMAPEVLLHGRVSKAADVYAFGIFLWEIFTADEPYADVPRILLGHVITKEGKRPSFPANTPRVYVELAERCWSHHASERPTFAEIQVSLRSIMGTFHDITKQPFYLPTKAKTSSAQRRRSLLIRLTPPQQSAAALRKLEEVAGPEHMFKGEGPALALKMILPAVSSCNTSLLAEAILRPDGSRDMHGSQHGAMSGVEFLDTTAEMTLDLLDQILEGGEVNMFAVRKVRELIAGTGDRRLKQPLSMVGVVEPVRASAVGEQQLLTLTGSLYTLDQDVNHTTALSTLLSQTYDKAVAGCNVSDLSPETRVGKSEGASESPVYSAPQPSVSMRCSGTRSPTAGTSIMPVIAGKHLAASPATKGSGPSHNQARSSPITMLQSPSDKVCRVLSQIDQWKFDIFTLDEVTEGRSLSVVTYAVVHRCGLQQSMMLDDDKLAKFLHRLEDGYGQNPYHCRIHAADVVRSLYCLLIHGGVMDSTTWQEGWELTLLASILAAVIHDYDHRGVNNDFLIKTNDPLAVLYNDTSPMENHHLAASFLLLHGDALNFLHGMTTKLKAKLRKRIISLVMATDMKQHVILLSSFEAKIIAANLKRGMPRTSDAQKLLLQQGPMVSGNEELLTDSMSWHSGGHVPVMAMDEDFQDLVLKMSIKCADLSFMISSWDVHKEWVKRQEHEFLLQGDQERRLGLPVSPLMDRNKEGRLSRAQPGLFSVVGLPLFRAFSTSFPRTSPLLLQATDNYNRWLEISSSATAE
ncbi:hypothetical protein CEUSTIGMA_g5985.t1 [Chlamydomonas eustigma]|uniref:Phosphodiesterase n=1 Tax=Chlamydomonas eustigma TaxID=1157962 RepID=A0A250X646_9CHLO|nr:hypothetical protein CEUSTIGMA_g5985.t1 [Chlamydomonas eustigma]|eukprot:GAX78545.1 hypothetical protein CEUSTIGMA_g5985.t1 [Chlamydomonas eustigma]